MASSASTRFEFRLRPETKKQIEHAAGLVHESASDFVRAAAASRAEQVLHDHDVVTTVPADFFDQIGSASPFSWGRGQATVGLWLVAAGRPGGRLGARWLAMYALTVSMGAPPVESTQ